MDFVLAQRAVQNRFKKESNLNKLDTEVITFAYKTGLFNSYKLRKAFSGVYPQYLKKATLKLCNLGLCSSINQSGNKIIFLLTSKGNKLAQEYFNSFID